MKIVLYNKQRTKAIVDTQFIEAGFLKSKYIKNEWKDIDLKTRIIYFILNDMKLFCNEIANNKSLKFLETELNHKGINW